MLKNRIHQLYTGHQAIQLGLNNETLSEQLQREREQNALASRQIKRVGLNNETLSEQLQREKNEPAKKERKMAWSTLALGTVATLPMFAYETPLVYLSAFMGTVLVSTSVTVLAEEPINKSIAYLSGLKDDMLAFIANKEGISIADMHNAVLFDKEELVNLAFLKSKGMLESTGEPGADFYIESKYSSLKMPDEQRIFFDKAVQSIMAEVDYRIDPSQMDDLREALIESKTGAVIMTPHGFSEEIEGKLVALRETDESPAFG